MVVATGRRGKSMDDAELIPFIAKANYPAFRTILKDQLPKSWEEWRHRHREYVADFAKRGSRVEPIPIDPHKFTRYLSRTGKARNLKSLAEFAIDLAAGYDG